MRARVRFLAGVTSVCCAILAGMGAAQAQDLRSTRIPLAFEENRGQADAQVRYVARGLGGTVFVTRDGVVLADGPRDSVRAVRLEFVGAGEASPVGEAATGGFANYYRTTDAKNWLSRIPMFKSVRYPGIYPGIDAVFHGNDDQLEYDFEIAPGTEASDIAFRFDGAERVSIGADGELEVVAGSEIWHVLAPVAYQRGGAGKLPVRASYRMMAENTVSLDAGEYDHSAMLVIDPVVQYANLIRGNSDVFVNAIQADSSGDLIIAASAFAGDLPVVNGQAFSQSGSEEVYLTKVNPAGDTLLYATYIPSSGFGGVNAMVLDGNGNAFVTGTAGGPDFPVTSTNLGTCSNTPCNTGFAAKFGPDGSMVYSTLLSSGVVVARSIAVDATGSAYLGGQVGDTSLQTVNAFEPVCIQMQGFACNNAFFAKLNAAGDNYAFASYFASPTVTFGSLVVNGIGLDASGNIFLGGTLTQGGLPPLLNPWQLSNGEIFLSKFAPDGRTLIFSTIFGSSETDSLTGMAVGNDGTVFLAGSTQSQDFPFTANGAGHQIVPGGVQSPEIFATAVDPTLTKLTYSVDLGLGAPGAIAIDSNNHLLMAGGNLLPLTNAVVSDLSQLSNGSYLELDASGALVTFSEFGGHQFPAMPTAIAADASDDVYIAGEASPNNAFFPFLPDPVTVGAPFNYNPTDSFGIFLAKIIPANEPQISLNGNAPAVILRDAGSVDLHISSITLGGGLAKQGGNCGDIVPAGTSCVLTVTDANGLTASGTITITSDAQPSTQTFSASIPSQTIAGQPVGDLVVVQDESFTYPPQLQGTSTAAIPMTVWNVGTANATINTVSASGTGSLTQNCVGILKPNKSCLIQVSDTPDSNGDIGNFQITYDTNTRLDFFLDVTGSPQQILLSSAGFDFGTQLVGGVAIPRVVAATNTGNNGISAPTVSIDGDPEFSIVANTCTSNLAPHQSCFVGVQFNPTMDDTPSGTLTIAGQAVMLAASGQIGSVINVAPLELDFFQVVAGEPGKLPLALNNLSNSAVGISGVSFSLPVFSETDNCGGQVPANGTCTLEVSFAPDQLGSVQGTMTVSFSGGVVAQVITLTGTGVAPLDVNPTSLDFGNTTSVGTTSATQFIELSNGRGASPQPYTISFTGDFIVAQNNCPSPVPGFMACGVGIAFQPQSPGAQQGALTLSYPGISVQTVVTLTGTGTTPTPVASVPASVDFGSEAVGESSAHNVTVTNTGSATLMISGLALSGANASDFGAAAGQCATVMTGTACNIQVMFTPSASGTRQATLTITDNAPNSPQTIAISGTGAAAVMIEAAPGSSLSATVSSGGTAVYKITAAAAPGFSAMVQFSCGGAPANATCTVQPDSVDYATTASANLTVSVQIGASSSAIFLRRSSALFGFIVGIPILFVFRRRVRIAAAGVFILIALCLAGCGGGGSTSANGGGGGGTPAGTYTLTLTASGGGQTQSVPLQLIVN